MKVRGANLGNWLVLEKWMGESPLSFARAEDDRGLIDEFPPEELALALERHRATYITEFDFVWMAQSGIDLVRIPVPYYLFGSDHHTPCIEHLDHAFEWAERWGLKILVDLHTVPLSQNAFDNGGYMGLCAWAQDPVRIDNTVDLLEQIARRYAGKAALWGIEALNEPASQEVLDRNLNIFGAEFPERAARSEVIPRDVLLGFYDRVYQRLRPIVGPDVALVFHDQFDLASWDELLPASRYENIVIDTHMYLNFSEWGFSRFDVPEYQARIAEFAEQIRAAAQHHQVLVGEWCLGNHSPLKRELDEEGKKDFYRALSDAQLDAWDEGIGGCYWSYRADDPNRKDWDLRTCVAKGWIDLKRNREEETPDPLATLLSGLF
ncbi:MAG: cellulase family glycosylhydrolase [Coriobacteriales bacterium]|nr:cellulase family glycosylhydrolase [Coriobacteriales bacterium]